MRTLLRSPKALLGLAILAGLTIMAVIGPWVAPYDPSFTTADILQGPSLHHLLGTTQTGQDVLSQILVGARTTMLVGLVAGVVATVLAVIVGVSAGYFGGKTDEFLSMTSNIFLVIPALPLMIVLSAYVKNGGWLTIALVISFTAWAFGARVLRAQAMSLRQRDYIRASRAMGERWLRIVLVEMMPNLTAVIVTNFLFTFMAAVLAQSGLAFLGLGSTSQWSWGEILFWAESAQAFSLGTWWWYIPPGICIALVGMSLTLINLGADEILDPRLSGRRGTRRQRAHDQVSVPDERQHASGEGGPPLLEIRGLTVDYGAPSGLPLRAVDGVSIALRTGETLGLAGESGSGKSTLAYAATRLLRPPGQVTQGQVLHRGPDGSTADLLAMSDEELQAFRWEELAIVFQSAMNALNPVHDIGTQLGDTLAVHRPHLSRSERSTLVKDLMEAVGVPADRLRSYPHELSGGMRQRVMIAMSLILDPSILVLDEPTTALDVVVQRAILTRLAELHDRFGFAVLFITHDVSLLIEIADRIAVMYAGRIVELGPSGDLYRDPRHPYTRGLLDSFPALHGPRRQVTGIPDNPPDLRIRTVGCPFAPRCSYAFGPCTTITPVLRALTPEGDRSCACHLQDPQYAPEGVRVGLGRADQTEWTA